MSAYQRSARRLVAAVGLILGGFAVSALADTGDRTRVPRDRRSDRRHRAGPRRDLPTPHGVRRPAVRAAQARRTFSTPDQLEPDRDVAPTASSSGPSTRAPTASRCIRTDDEQGRCATIKVGDEPQSVALDPTNRYAYVANAAGSTRHA